MPRNKFEQELQIAVCNYLSYLGLSFYAIINQQPMSHHNRSSAMINTQMLKRQGLKKGIPDLCVTHSSELGYHGLYIELKSDKGRLSQDQVSWQNTLMKLGYYCVVCRSIDDVIAVIEYYKPVKYVKK